MAFFVVEDDNQERDTEMIALDEFVLFSSHQKVNRDCNQTVEKGTKTIAGETTIGDVAEENSQAEEGKRAVMTAKA